MTLDDAVEVMDLATELMEGREYAVDSADVLNLTSSSSCSAYDCEFVALAQELGVPLVTADRGIRRSFREETVSLAEFPGKCNVIAYLLLPSEHTPAARAAYQRDPIWAAPLLWRSEFRNVLATSIHQGHMTLEDAVEVVDVATELMEGWEYACCFRGA